MPRPPKCRRICAMPRHCRFQSMENPGGEVQHMTLEEYEVIRLIDHEGMTQEECAGQMGIARTTAQHIYEIARKKLASFIVEGSQLHIDGGNYILCQASTCQGRHNCGKGSCGCTQCGMEKCEGTE